MDVDGTIARTTGRLEKGSANILNYLEDYSEKIEKKFHYREIRDSRVFHTFSGLGNAADWLADSPKASISFGRVLKPISKGFSVLTGGFDLLGQLRHDREVGDKLNAGLLIKTGGIVGGSYVGATTAGMLLGVSAPAAVAVGTGLLAGFAVVEGADWLRKQLPSAIKIYVFR